MFCDFCKTEMRPGVKSCANRTVEYADGVILPGIPWGMAPGDELFSGEPCGDCGVMPGGFHHPCCDQERCPRCKGQLIGCNCPIDTEAIA